MQKCNIILYTFVIKLSVKPFAVSGNATFLRVNKGETRQRSFLCLQVGSTMYVMETNVC